MVQKIYDIAETIYKTMNEAGKIAKMRSILIKHGA